MIGDLFNGLFGSSKASKSSDIQTQLDQLQYARDEAIRQSDMGKAYYYQHILEQQQALMNRGMGSGSGGFTETMRYTQIKQTEYDELTSLSNWCQNVHPEVYEEWRAMQDLKKASEDESP